MCAGITASTAGCAIMGVFLSERADLLLRGWGRPFLCLVGYAVSLLLSAAARRITRLIQADRVSWARMAAASTVDTPAGLIRV
jgi:hypothetical protein